MGSEQSLSGEELLSTSTAQGFGSRSLTCETATRHRSPRKLPPSPARRGSLPANGVGTTPIDAIGEWTEGGSELER